MLALLETTDRREPRVKRDSTGNPALLEKSEMPGCPEMLGLMEKQELRAKTEPEEEDCPGRWDLKVPSALLENLEKTALTGRMASVDLRLGTLG